MNPHDPTTPRGAARSELAETREGPGNLFVDLDAIAVEGWDGPTATELLRFVRSHLVRPLVVDVGLRGGAASEAEATAWEVLWLKLKEPSLRTARSPWGVLWQTARRAVLGEILAERWGAPETGVEAGRHGARRPRAEAHRP